MDAKHILLENWQSRGANGFDADEIHKMPPLEQRRRVVDWFTQTKLRATSEAEILKKPITSTFHLEKCLSAIL